MNSEELIKALRFCGKHECITCPCDIDECSQMVYDAANQIERDQKELAALREKVTQWISVEDRMPDTVPCDAGTEYSEAVVVWTNGNKAMIAVWDGIDWICPCDFWEAWGEEITHWMPLPEPPKEV